MVNRVPYEKHLDTLQAVLLTGLAAPTDQGLDWLISNTAREHGAPDWLATEWFWGMENTVRGLRALQQARHEGLLADLLRAWVTVLDPSTPIVRTWEALITRLT